MLCIGLAPILPAKTAYAMKTTNVGQKALCDRENWAGLSKAIRALTQTTPLPPDLLLCELMALGAAR